NSSSLIEKLKKWTSIHDIYSLKKVIENNKISHKMLVYSLELLADSSVFKFYSIEAISELELHLRTLVALIEVICKTQFENFNPSSNSTTSSDILNDSKVYKNGKRNYNIDFLLLHLRDTLHCMRDDETKFSEVWRRAKKFLRIILGVAPRLVKKGIIHGSDLPIDNGVELLFKHLQGAFTWKYPISSWYYEWRTLLELHFNLQNFLQESSLPSKYGESLLLECLWYCVSKNWSNPISQSESLTNKKHFVNNLLGMEPLAFPHSLWFGALDIAQALIAKTLKDSTLGICYYLALESLQKAPTSFIHLDSVKLHQMIEAIREKSFQDEKLVDTNKNNVDDLKEKGKVIPANSSTSAHIITSSDDFISEIVTIELSCPPTCPFCRKIINLNSVINLPQSAIYQGIRNYLPEDNINVTQDHRENISNDSSDEEINLSKLKSQQKFKMTTSTVRKFFKTPKFLSSSLRKKADIAYKLGEFETTINILTEILEQYPTSYSLQYYRAKVYTERNKFYEAIKDLDSAIKQKPYKFDAYLLRGITYFSIG
ncbi:26862_t:CDS:2, partial [Gigaspora margarita]